MWSDISHARSKIVGVFFIKSRRVSTLDMFMMNVLEVSKYDVCPVVVKAAVVGNERREPLFSNVTLYG